MFKAVCVYTGTTHMYQCSIQNVESITMLVNDVLLKANMHTDSHRCINATS